MQVSEVVCPDCLYVWGERLPEHVRFKLCRPNLQIRKVVEVFPESLMPATPYEELIEGAGLELWRLPSSPVIYAPVWAVNVCRVTGLQAHRGWLLRLVAHNPGLQSALSRPQGSEAILVKLLRSQYGVL